MPKKYTELEDQFLKDYPDSPIKELAEALGRSISSIKSRRQKIGISKTKEELYHVDGEGNKVPEDKKYCPKCNKVLPLDDFYRSATGTKGRYYICKSCSREKAKIKFAKKKNGIQETTDKKKELQEKIKDEIFLCPYCKKEKKGSEFGVYGTVKKGIKRASYCRECEIKKDSERRLKVLKEKGY